MGDGRSSGRNLDEFSKAVATLKDIFFIPSDNLGNNFLRYCTQVVEEKRSEWARSYQMPKPVSETADLNYLESLNPTEWKNQDHYAVLGLRHLRIRASEEDLRKSYRIRCLKHHPDKRMAAGQFVANPEGDYFGCIVKAFEILGTSKRRSYDSVDPLFNDYIPPKNIKDSVQFFKVYGRWFFLNSQWSATVPVPLLGNMFTARHDVESFYDFWYNFDSWREYSYLDEEEKEKGAFREERRWIDKQNKAARAKLKKEEMGRIRLVVDNAYISDPRLLLFKQQDLRKKLEIKEAKKKVQRQKQMIEENTRRATEAEEKLRRDKEEEEMRERELKLKKEKDTLKKALKKERKILRTICGNNNFYGADDHKIQLKNMSHLEHLCEVLSLSDLEMLNKKLADLSIADATQLFSAEVRKITQKDVKPVEPPTPIVEAVPRKKAESLVREWTVEEQKLLEQALKTYPATDTERWAHIADCIPGRTKKECMTRFKDLAAIVKAKKAQNSEGKSKAL